MGAAQIKLVKDDGWWIATNVTSQGKTREAALTNLDEAVEAYEGAGDKPTDDELRKLGSGPAANS